MRILLAHSFYRVPGGEDRHVEQLVGLLQPHHEVRLLARRNEDLTPGPSTAGRMVASRRELRAVQEEMATFRPDVVHLHNPYPSLGPVVHLAAHRLGIKLVVTVHNLRLRCPNGLMFTEGAPCRRCEKGNYVNAVIHRCFPSRSQAAAYATALWVHRFLLRIEDRVDVFIAPSGFIANRLGEWGIPGVRIETIRPFVSASGEGRATPGIGGVYVGRLRDEKGLDLLLRALSEADDPPFLIVGDGPMRAELATLARGLGLTRTRFLGPLPPSDAAKVIAESRFLAMPSVCEESAGLAAMEAMVKGRPVLVSDRGALPELVSSGGGLICNPDDIADVAQKIRRLMAEDELCRRLGEEALGTASAEFGPAGHLHRLETLYRRVCGMV